MKFFLDTAILDEIKEAAAWGILDGVTTNPSLVTKSGESDFHGLIVDICEIVNGPVSAEVVSTELDGIMSEGRELAKLHDHVVVKVPMIPEGLKAIKKLSSEGIKTNCTLNFSPVQSLMAAKAGATYVSPFVGRIDDIGHRGMDVIEQIRIIFDNYAIETAILAASIRHPLHVMEAAMAGADVSTLPFGVMKKLFNHPLTDSGLEQFLADWRKRKQ